MPLRMPPTCRTNPIRPAFDVLLPMIGPDPVLDLMDMNQQHLTIRFATHVSVPRHHVAGSLALPNRLVSGGSSVAPRPAIRYRLGTGLFLHFLQRLDFK